MPRNSLLYVVQLILCTSVLAQDPPFTVTRPDPGDTLVLSSYEGANELYIDWTIAPGTEDQPVLISLQRGDDVESLETIETVNGTAPNNGSYTWDGRDSISLASGTDPWLARTACNYTVRLSVDGLLAYSQYFTIINEDDGPISDSTTCPVERGVARPEFANATTNSTVLGNEDATSSSNGGEGGRNGGISPSTLAVAIVVPIVALLIIFGLALWLAIRRGWFVKFANRRENGSNLTHDNTAGFSQRQSGPASTVAEKKAEAVPPYGSPPQELHSHHRAWEAAGRQVHQLAGDERDATIRDGSMRPS